MQQSGRMPGSSTVSRASPGCPTLPGTAPDATPPAGLACGTAADTARPGGDPDLVWSQALGQIRPHDTLALAVRLPMCPQTCAHCSNTPRLHGTRAAQQGLLQALSREVALAAEAGAARGEVVDLRFTGGSVNVVGSAVLQPLVQALRTQLRVTRSATWSLTADPRACTPDELSTLRALGFDTLVLGVGDLDGAVQAGIGRLVSPTLLDDVVRQAWRLRWRQVQIDLVCGLPGQHPQGWLHTLRAVLALGPTRIRCRPARRSAAAHPAQQVLAPDAWPAPETLPVLSAATVRLLGEAGYQPLDDGVWVLEDDPWLRDVAGLARLPGGATGTSGLAPVHRLAFGPAGCSRVAGWQVLNESDPVAYIGRLRDGRSAVRHLRPPTAASTAQWRVAQGLCSGDPWPSLSLLPAAEHGLAAAVGLGWARRSETGWLLTDAGHDHLGALLSLLEAGPPGTGLDLHTLVALAAWGQPGPADPPSLH